MDWLLVLKIVWAALSLAALLSVLVVLWRARGILSWKRSLEREMGELAGAGDESDPAAREAAGIVVGRCGEVFGVYSPELGELRDMPDFIRSIAACFHPGVERPELRVTAGAFLRSLEKSLGRLDRLLGMRGFRMLRSITIRNVKSSHEWYARVSRWRLLGWYLGHRRWIRRLSLFRFLILPDPFSLLAYFSHRLTLLTLTKYLMVELYLFSGRLALEAYGNRENRAAAEGREELEEVLEAMETLEEGEETGMDPAVRQVRDRLVGFTAMLTSNPSFIKWKDSVVEAAEIIARKHFPESEAPLEEAALGPLVERTRSWLGAFTKREEYPLLKYFYRMRLETLYKAKNFSETYLPKPVRSVLRTSLRTYVRLKWPMKVYRMIKRISPWKIALEVGWQVTKKAGLARLYGKTFDRACGELEIVYSRSRRLGEGSAPEN